MSVTARPTLEERVAALEKVVGQLLAAESTPAAFKDWRMAIGMFPGSPLQKEIDEAGAEIRAADRQDAAT